MDEKWMTVAISLAKATQGQTSPNPSVGCVIVKNGRIIGMGAHLKAGEGHAEVQAMMQSGEEAADSTVYVTLEPCSHYGKTPPCAELLVKNNVARVVIATLDPNPLVAGNGADLLREAGIHVTVGTCEKEAWALNPFFFHSMQKNRPFITLKGAMTLDGKIATVNGDSKWITSSEARQDVHKDRHLHDAILVGKNTILHDDPLLTTRLPDGGGISPIRIVLDTQLALSETAQVIMDDTAQTWLFCGKGAPEDKEAVLSNASHVTVFRLDTPSIHLHDVVRLLHQKKVQSVYVEGGASIHGAFLDAGLADRVILYVAPKIVGTGAAKSVFNGRGTAFMRDATQLAFDSVETIGDDLKLTARIKRE